MKEKKLTQIQEKLAQAYILNNGNQSQSYRDVYPNNKSTPKSIWTLSSKAFSAIEVQSRITELQKLAAERHLITVETLTTELEEAREVGKTEGQAAAMATATMGKAKLHGMLTDKIESKVTIDIVSEFLDAIKPTTGLPSERHK